MSRPSTAAPSRPSGAPDEPPPSGATPEPRSSVMEIHSATEDGRPSPGPLPSAAWESRELAGALHEVSNALTVVLGWLDAATQSDEPTKIHGAVAVAREHARRGRQLARQAIGADEDLPSAPRGASELARFAATSVQPRGDAGRVHLELTEGLVPDVVLDDAAPALQVLTNLLLNAIDFSPGGGTVRMGVTCESTSVVFVVRDEGPGIPEERRATLFVDPASTRPGGAGIGLTYSRHLARQCGGDLRLVPTQVGACFELVWPRARTTALRPSGMDQQDARALYGARILVVEDDPAIASLLELSLEARGADVLLAESAESLVQVLGGRPLYDAALLDLSPLKDRLTEWLEKIQDQAPGAPLLLVSGHPDGVPEEAEGRFSAWVRKPFEMRELLETLDALLVNRDKLGDPGQ